MLDAHKADKKHCYHAAQVVAGSWFARLAGGSNAA